MNSIGKTLTLLLVALLLSSLLVISITPVNVQAASKPPAPEFTVKIVDKSYNEPSTQSTDTYTGKTTTHPGYRIEKKVIEVTIKNQNPSVMFSVRSKGHFEEWPETHDDSDGFGDIFGGGAIFSGAIFYPDIGKYTAIEWTIEYYPDEAQIDIQTIALLGTFKEEMPYGLRQQVFYGEKSEWSKTQTITINKNNNQTPYNPNQNDPKTPTNPNQPINLTNINLLTITIITITITITITLLILRKTTNKKTFQQ